MEYHGSIIKDLTVDNMYCCVDPVELNFYEALTNLESLEIETVHITAHWNECNYPANLCANLKKLKINKVLVIPDDDGLPGRVDYVYKLYEYCVKCEYLKYPLYRHAETGAVIMNFGLFDVIGNLLNGTNEDRDHNLKVYDLSSFKYESEWNHPLVVSHFVDFMTLVIESGFKLMGLDTNYLVVLVPMIFDLNVKNQLGRCLQSITNVSGLMFMTRDAPYIEEIDIGSTARCSLNGYRYYEDANQWPHLKKLSMCVDSKTLDRGGYGEHISDLYDKFFRPQKAHEDLTELTLLFEGMDVTVCPSAASIISSCPNVKKLKLKNWPGTNKALSKLWAGLHSLEQVCLDACVEMGNVAFVGEDKANPTFLGLKNLKKLELLNLDKMPKISDTIFSLVFRHLKLTHFIIQSDDPIENVSSVGIRSLLTGEFANSIVKFPFQGWSLADIPEESFEELGAEFRSTYMI